MELGELEQQRLPPFVRAHYDDPEARVFDVHLMPGHAGFAYGFSVESRGVREAWFLRLPPPGVAWKGTADVLRQATILNALDETDVPHCPLKWSGDDLAWFGRPYFVVPKLEGDVLRLAPGEWAAGLGAKRLHEAAKQAVAALASLHRMDWERAVPQLGPPIPLQKDVERWDRFVSKLADPERFGRLAEVRGALLGKAPQQARIGVFHGDFQPANLFFSFEGELLAVIDWELVGIGAVLNDLGWLATFTDPKAWAEGGPKVPEGAGFPDADALVAMYVEMQGEDVEQVAWFRALAAYKFAVITGLNLGLHRRGKRPDPLWEQTVLSVEPLLERAAELLCAG